MTPQFSVLCGTLHFAHFGRASFSLGQAMAIWSLPLQSWHPPKAVEEDDDAESCEFPLKKLMRVLFNAVTCFSTLLFNVSSSCSSRRGSYGVSPSSPRTLSTLVATPTNSSMSASTLTTHNFRISGLSLARNHLLCSTSCIWPFRNNLSSRSKYFCTLSLGSCLMASIFIWMSSASMFPYFWIINV